MSPSIYYHTYSQNVYNIPHLLPKHLHQYYFTHATELWTYLKEAVTSNAVVSVDDLVEKLVTTVSSIPQPYLKSVVKESIKKQKSIEEGMESCTTVLLIIGNCF